MRQREALQLIRLSALPVNGIKPKEAQGPGWKQHVSGECSQTVLQYSRSPEQ